MASTRLRHIALVLTASLLLLGPRMPARAEALPGGAAAHPRQGCTVFYGFDGQTALGANNEDFMDPFTQVWFIPASPGHFGRVYFGFDDYLPQGGLNDQGVFFDGLALAYKAMPETSGRPHFPGGDLALVDEILSRSANVQDVLDITGQWNRMGGEYAQFLYGDRFGDSVILDGDTILRKQGSFQLATNFRLVENPDPPYPEERYGRVSDMLANADTYTVELFRDALDVAHAEGDYPTIYSQVYELNTGIIHLYQYHDFEHEVVLNLAEELAKGPHSASIASLFPRNEELEQWAAGQEQALSAGFEDGINSAIDPASLSWMSGQYTLEEPEAGTAKVYLENNQLYLQRPNQLPIELYPVTSDTVFHPFFDGLELTLTFQQDARGQASGAQGTFGYEPYGMVVPYKLTRSEVSSSNLSLLITILGIGIALILALSILIVLRKRRKQDG